MNTSSTLQYDTFTFTLSLSDFFDLPTKAAAVGAAVTYNLNFCLLRLCSRRVPLLPFHYLQRLLAPSKTDPVVV